jgi:hypothetical protein
MVRREINASLTLRLRAGELGAAAKQSPMPRTATTIGERDLERALLRRSVDAASGELDRCVDCGRTPLIGETLYRYAADATVCELCRPLRREAPQGSELVRNSECGDAVRVQRLTRA